MRRRAVVAIAIVLLASCSSVAVEDPSATPQPSPVPARAPAAVAEGPELVDPPAPAPRPAQPTIDVRLVAALPPDYCVDRDLRAPAAADPALVVLDRTHALAPDAAPSDLVPASVAGLTGASGAKLVRAVIADDLAAMRAAWEAEGLTVQVDSGYRSYASQADTFDEWVGRLGHAEALMRSARPGHSEHQLGTALDLTSPGWAGRFGDWATESAEGAWLAAHAWEYGFVMSYPSGGQAETCFSYEPWHYRWIGRDLAAAHRASGRSLRAFLERQLDG